MKCTIAALAALAIGSSGAHAAATTIQVKFQTLGPAGFAPVTGFFHNGSFDIFTPGTVASAALETLAEVGNPMPLLATAPAGVSKGTNGAPFGSNTTVMFNVSVADGNSSFSYAAMLLPSNDWFIGNDNAFDVSSLLNAVAGTSLSFDVSTVWNAGTELEDFAFSAGNPLFGIPAGNDSLGTAEGGVIGVRTGANPFAAFASQPPGFDPNSLDFTGGPVGRFTLTVVPETGAASLLGLAGLAALSRRRRR